MLRLIEYMTNNPTIKRQIFESFNQEDLEKILKNLNEKKTFFFEKSLAYFYENCQNFMRSFDLIPINSKIVLNGIPEKLSQHMTSDLSQKLNQIQPSENSLYWYYPLQLTREKLPNLSYFQLNSKELKKQVNDFVDPSECMIGTTYRKLPIRTPQSDIQNWNNRHDHHHKMSIHPVNKQMASLILPLQEINNPRYYQRYVAKFFNQQQYKNLLSNTQREDISFEKQQPRSQIPKNKFL
ncbi:unnamed protein product (macronuclear) [Paramecium tetraurelia]|uniref:Uncharacterized protein n=1 Tax=Paramecium tetraurelia TaxID=5888 RepID=A0BIF0_PARTE|nr:uncharacterized protein GSPATT00004689001 [Paramecium tetraurelia]CAK58317.1 unnamed protein product [Paramecium tetraurelia]|eukprot:XP_001425715.1 hypothetical protein (macronuclear) [Paramecium tetraurelia strain d4-2]